MWSLGMILHKLLFFKLPYRYAADKEDSGSIEEGETMTQLEQEIQTYSGCVFLLQIHARNAYVGYVRFKPTSALVSAFEARRLPRAYLVLLEGLLNVNPTARPTCERVLMAIREGRVR